MSYFDEQTPCTKISKYFTQYINKEFGDIKQIITRNHKQK